MSSLESGASVEIADCVFCASHRSEVCQECNFDGREENDSFFGFDTVDREPIDPPATTTTKDGIIQCKKHGNAECKQCFGWKKQIMKLQKEAKKAGK